MVEQREQAADEQHKIAKNKTGVESVDAANEKNYLEAELAAINAKTRAMGGDPDAGTNVPPPKSLESAYAQLHRLQAKDTGRMSADEQVKHKQKIADAKEKIAVRTLKWQVAQAKQAQEETKQHEYRKPKEETQQVEKEQNQFSLKSEHGQFNQSQQHNQFSQSKYAFGNFTNSVNNSGRSMSGLFAKPMRGSFAPTLKMSSKPTHLGTTMVSRPKLQSPITAPKFAKSNRPIKKKHTVGKRPSLSSKAKRRPALPKVGSIKRTGLKTTSFSKPNMSRSKLRKRLF